MKIKVNTRHHGEIVFLIDREDYPKIKDLTLSAWHDKGKNSFRLMALRKTVVKILMNCPDELAVNFINGNTLDCRKKNLRVCDKTLVARHVAKKKPGSSSKYMGLYWHKKASAWGVQIRADGRQIYLGLYKDEIEAAKAYNKVAKTYLGKLAKLNKFGGSK